MVQEIIRMSESNRSKFIKFIGYTIPILLLAYVLSVGPTYAIVTNSILERELPSTLVHPGITSFYSEFEQFESFYAPLLWIGEKNLFIYELLADYMEFCHASIFVNRESSFETSLNFR